MSVFSKELQDKIESYLKRYETRRSAILPILHSIQDECEWIRPDHIQALEDEYQLSKVQVQEVATFYSDYRLEKPAKYRIQFCNNMVCQMLGGDEVMDSIKAYMKKLPGNEQGEVMSMKGVPCLGVCDGAPAMLVNKDRHLKVTQDNFEAILKKYE